MNNRLDNWIHNTFEVTPGGLALFRIFYALYVLLAIMPGVPPYVDYGFLADLPSDLFFPPPGPMMLFGDFPPMTIINQIEFGIIAGLVFILFGWKTRTASIVTGLLIIIGNGFSFSMGKINHDLILPLVPLVMSFSNWGKEWSVDAQGNEAPVESWPVTLLALFLGFMMFTAGFPKILGGWLDPGSLATYGHLVNQHYVSERTDLLSAFFLTFEHHLFWIALDYITIIFEIGFLFAIFNAKIFRLFCAFAVLFHFSVMLMLNISFIPNLAAYGLFLFNWNAYAEWFSKSSIRESISDMIQPFTQTKIVMALVLVLAFFWYVKSPLVLLNDLYPLSSDLLFYEVVVLTLFVPVALLRMFQVIRGIVVMQPKNKIV